jgi:hypothetical protein
VFRRRGHLDTVENEPERSSTHCQTHEGLDVNLCAIDQRKIAGSDIPCSLHNARLTLAPIRYR